MNATQERHLLRSLILGPPSVWEVTATVPRDHVADVPALLTAITTMRQEAVRSAAEPAQGALMLDKTTQGPALLSWLRIDSTGTYVWRRLPGEVARPREATHLRITLRWLIAGSAN